VPGAQDSHRRSKREGGEFRMKIKVNVRAGKNRGANGGA
jgi:hypothetical protein